MAKKKKSSGPNKSQAIRDYMAENPSATPTDVVNGLGATGITVTTALVSNVKTNMKGKKKKRGRPGRKPGRKPGRPAGTAAKSSDVSFAALMAAKRLTDEMGSVEQAKAALEALAKLGV